MPENTRTYKVDGVTYTSLSDMPTDVRAKVEAVLADRNGDGVPDIMQDFTFASVKPGGAMKLVTDGVATATAATAATAVTRAAGLRNKPWFVPALVAAAIVAIVIFAVIRN